MANCCSTRITINHESESKLKELEKLIGTWTSKDRPMVYFRNSWLGNIILNSGIGTIDTNPETDLKCCGDITWMRYKDNQLSIDTETAWSPALKMWVKLLEKYLPDAELIYQTEECGCALYATNDPCLMNFYVIDCWDMEEIDTDYEASAETVREILQELLNTAEEDLEELINMIKVSEYKEKIAVYKWEYQDVHEWD